MRISATVFLFWSFWFGVVAQCKTLDDVLKAHLVPTQMFTSLELMQSITNQYATSTQDSPFLLAYYVVNKSGMLSPPLNVVRYDYRRQLVRRAVLHEAELPGKGRSGALNQLTTECLGSVLNIEEHGEYVEIGTHINPSAGCTLVLSIKLSFVTELFGWVQGRVGEYLVLQENTVHFAPTHPLRLMVYDPQRGLLRSVYPMRHDRARQRFSAKLKMNLPSRSWCQTQNNACDPEVFSADVVRLSADKPGLRFTFDVEMRSEGFGDGAEQHVPLETVHYACRQRRSSGQMDWICAGSTTP